MEVITLNNGLKVLVYPMLNTHSVTIGLYIKAGCGYEKGRFVGATHLLEHLHFRKCGSFSQEELYYRMERIGSTLRAVTYRDFLQFTMKVIPRKTEECIEIFKNIIEGNNWTDEEFEKEKQVVLNQILEKGTYITLDKEMRKLVFKNHSLNSEIMGDIITIESLRKSDIQEYKKELFSKQNMLFCVTGNIKEMDYKNMLEELQRISIGQNDKEKRIQCPSIFQHRKPDILLKHVQDDNPLEVNISFDIKYDDESRDLLMILNCILGEGVGSRLQKTIREEKCYSSNIASYIEWYQKFAVLHINFSVEKGALLSCLQDIVMILKKMKKEIVKRDLDVTLPFYTTNHVFCEDDTEEMNFQLAYNKLILGMEYRSVALKNDDKTILSLQRLAENIFAKNNMSLVLVGNMEEVTKKDIMQIIDKI